MPKTCLTITSKSDDPLFGEIFITALCGSDAPIFKYTAIKNNIVTLVMIEPEHRAVIYGVKYEPYIKTTGAKTITVIERPLDKPPPDPYTSFNVAERLLENYKSKY